MIILLAILYILVVIAAIALTRARKYANDWEETFKKEAMNHPDKKCPICKTSTNLDFHYNPCPKCSFDGSTFNPLYDRNL